MVEKIVFTNGCFDIIHAGHIDYLGEASKLGYLIVGLNSDKSMKLIKKRKPLFNQNERKKILESIRFVDKVIIFEDDTPYKLIKKINPDIYIKGGDYVSIDSIDKPIRELIKDKLKIIPKKFNVSSSMSIKKIRERK